ncbi:MAG: glycosyltransferase family 39 protein [Elusimicrobiota bacterium]|nr:MAG: glycosyltransferase family 39 protein [Elusimicrobiota bacterium]
MTRLPGRGVMLAAVAGLSVLVHLVGLGAPSLDYHHHRQVNTASIARNYAREDRPVHRPRVDWEGPEDRLAATELPLYMYALGKLWPLFGLGETWGRVLSLLASLLTALLLFLIFERELGREPAFYGALLFSVSPLEIYFGRTVQPEATALLGLVAALYFWDLSLEKRRPWWAVAVAAAAAFVSVGHKLPYAHVFIPLLALTWRRLGGRTWADVRMWAAGLVSMGLVLAWYRWASTGVYVVPTRSAEFASLFDYGRTLYFAQFLLASRFIELVTTYGGLVLFLVGARRLFVGQRDPFWLAWFFGALAHLLALGDYAHAHDYTALPLVPVAAGIMGAGAAGLRASKMEWARAAAVLLMLAVPVHSALRIRHWYRQGLDYLARAGEAANAVSLEDDLFVACGAAPSVLLYRLDRRGWWRPLELEGEGGWPVLEEKRRAGARFLACEKTGAMADGGALSRRLRAKAEPVWDDGRLVIYPLVK